MKIVCAGDCGVDIYTDLHLTKPGGISLNFAVHCKKLFSETDEIEVLGALGNDYHAGIVRQSLKKYSLHHNLVTLNGKTPIQHIANKMDGEKIFTKYDEGVLKNFKIQKKQKHSIQNADVVVSPLFDQVEPFFRSVLKTHTNATKVVDFLDLTDFGKNIFIVEKYIHAFDIAFFGLQSNEKELIRALEKLSITYAKLFIITLGKEGSLALFNGNRIHLPSKKVRNVIDTTGAGDAFSAAFLCEFLATRHIENSLKNAATYAAQIVQKVGSF